MSNSSLATYTKISPNKTSPRNHSIDTITIHCVVGQLSAESIASCFARSNVQASCNYGIGTDGRIALIVPEKDRSWCSSNRENDNRAITIECASDTTPPYAINENVYNSLIDLCVDICKRNNINGLKWRGDKSLIGQVDKQNMTVHRWFANKSCPGDYIYNRLGNIAADVNRRLGVANTSTTASNHTTSYTQKQFIRDIQSVTGSSVDGIAGPETIRNTITVSRVSNSRHAVVKYIQKWLIQKGYSCGSYGADGIFGNATDTAVRAYQRDNGCIADGEITARCTTWKKMLGMI